MRGNGHVFAHVDWQRMDEAQLDGPAGPRK